MIIIIIIMIIIIMIIILMTGSNCRVGKVSKLVKCYQIPFDFFFTFILIKTTILGLHVTSQKS